MTIARRLASVEATLSPTELIVRWLDEAHAYGDIVTHARAMLEAESAETPLDRLAREADAGARASAKGRRSEAISEAARTAVRETVFRFDLVLRILVTSHERLDREALVDAVLAAQLALLLSMDKRERSREPAYPRRVEMLRDLALDRVGELRLAQQAREQVETRYLGGHPALFPDAVAAWEEQVRSTEAIAGMAIRLAELDGVAPPEPDDADGAAARVTELVADLVEPARVTALEKLGEGARASGLAAGWVRSQLGPAGGDDAPTVTASGDR
jgi:hypothetical protein